ncbi:MAG: hypothetical protein GY913_03550 [Proteobacteria bacterium]|nr:hypothetical protein [Pseudomonadota bacterium]MCP4915976.1 hypothetical protein [Pseudomonadota bacterium]
MAPWLAETLTRMHAIGVNVHGVARIDGHEVLPAARSVVVLGSGGTALFDALCAEIRARPAALADEDHPLDSFVRRTLADCPTPADAVVVRAAGDETTFVDFRVLAHAAGLGHTSRLGLLLHDVHGPWLGLRVAVFTSQELSPTPMPASPNPCVDCTVCVPACPFDAITDAPDPRHGFDIRACAESHQTSDRCARTCHARMACPQGAPSRYSALQVHYHYDRSTGRRALAEHLRVDDTRSGAGPFWSDWSEDG